jgi:hypothetical protein
MTNSNYTKLYEYNVQFHVVLLLTSFLVLFSHLQLVHFTMKFCVHLPFLYVCYKLHPPQPPLLQGPKNTGWRSEILKLLCTVFMWQFHSFEDRYSPVYIYIYIDIYIYKYIQGPPKNCILTLTKENSMLYNRLL